MSDWALPEAGGWVPARTTAALPAPIAPARRRRLLRPATPSQLVDDGCRSLRRLARVLVPLVLACTLPISVGQALATRSLVNADDSGVSTSTLSLFGVGAGAFLTAGTALLFLFGMLRMLVQTVVSAAVAVIVVDERFGQDVRFVDALKRALRRLPTLFVVWFCVTGSVVLGGCTAAGGYVLTALWFVTVPVAMIERRGPFASMGRSWRLATRRFWPVLGVSTLSTLVGMLVGYAFSFVALLPLAFSLLESWSWLFAGVAAQINDLVTIPIAAAIAALTYLDLRIRTEGLDLQVDRLELVGHAAASR